MTFTFTYGVGWTTTQPAPLPMKGRRIDQITRAVAARHMLSVDELKGTARFKNICAARFEAMWLAYQELRPDGTKLYSLPSIGRYFGRDHTTVLNAIRRHEASIMGRKVAA